MKKTKKILSMLLVLIVLATTCILPVSAAYEDQYAGFQSVIVAPANLLSNGYARWYSSSKYTHIVDRGWNNYGSISTDLGKLKDLMDPSSANGWTGYFIEVGLPNSGANISVSAPGSLYSTYRTSDSYGFFIYAPSNSGFPRPSVTVTATYQGYRETVTIDLYRSGNKTLKPSGATNTVGPG